MVRRCFDSEDGVEEHVEYVVERKKYLIQKRRPSLDGGATSRVSETRKRNILEQSGELITDFCYPIIFMEQYD